MFQLSAYAKTRVSTHNNNETQDVSKRTTPLYFTSLCPVLLTKSSKRQIGSAAVLSLANFPPDIKE